MGAAAFQFRCILGQGDLGCLALPVLKPMSKIIHISLKPDIRLFHFRLALPDLLLFRMDAESRLDVLLTLKTGIKALCGVICTGVETFCLPCN